jgi:hypothetical protein
MIYNFLKGRGNLRIEKQMLELRKERGWPSKHYFRKFNVYENIGMILFLVFFKQSWLF